MILRVWRARADPDRRDAYPEHFRHSVLPGLRAVPGFLGATLSARDLDETVEFTVITRWASLEAIRGFAGDILDRAVVEPAAVAALRDYDRTVDHLTVIDDAGAPGAR
jgi:heme-degrading monooxygenase HmoA